MKVYKKNGKEVDFSSEKIKDAISKANKSTFKKFEQEFKDLDPNIKNYKYEDLLEITDNSFEWNKKNFEKNNLFFDENITKEKLIKTLSKHILVDGEFEKVLNTIQKYLKPFDTINVEDISDLVEKALMKHNAFDVAKEYIIYRDNKKKDNKFTSIEENVLSVIDGSNTKLRGDNANKKIDVNSSARDFIAGTVCKSIAEKVIPHNVVKAHKDGYIHWHDMDYSPVQNMTNCGLVNVEDMLMNGFQMGDTHINTPKVFSTAGNLASQISLIVSGLQYGGQTMSIAAFLPLVKRTRLNIAEEVKKDLLQL